MNTLTTWVKAAKRGDAVLCKDSLLPACGLRHWNISEISEEALLTSSSVSSEYLDPHANDSSKRLTSPCIRAPAAPPGMEQ